MRVVVVVVVEGLVLTAVCFVFGEMIRVPTARPSLVVVEAFDLPVHNWGWCLGSLGVPTCDIEIWHEVANALNTTRKVL